MDGILPIWKERGMTSFDCVYRVRKLLKTKKVGHTGTLDPAVAGVLPICVGKATKVVEYLLVSHKVYRGEITLGIATETEDAHGDVIEQKAVTDVPTLEAIDRCMQQMEGELTQIPPLYSAVKVSGKRLYEYARAGLDVVRPQRQVHIFSFERISDISVDEARKTVSWQFEVHCSKGTYVRTLAVDLGRSLGYPAHMSQLTRLASGSFIAADCITLAELERAVEAGEVERWLYPLERAFTGVRRIEVDDSLYVAVKNGAVIEKKRLTKEDEMPVLCVYRGQVVALYTDHPTRKGYIKPEKMF